MSEEMMKQELSDFAARHKRKVPRGWLPLARWLVANYRGFVLLCAFLT